MDRNHEYSLDFSFYIKIYMIEDMAYQNTHFCIMRRRNTSIVGSKGFIGNHPIVTILWLPEAGQNFKGG